MADDLRALTKVAPQVLALAEEVRALAGDDDLAFVDTLDGETDVISVARGAVRAMFAWEQQGLAARGLANRYDFRAKEFADRAMRVRSALNDFLGEMNRKTLPLPEATLSRAEPSLKKLVEHGDANVNNLPPNLRRTKMEPDKTAIREALERGVSVPGYSLANSEPVLKVRIGKAVQE